MSETTQPGFETPPEAAPQPSPSAPGRVGVLGGGRMGAGIAHAFLLAGSDVTVVERDDEAAEAARGRVLDSVATSVARGTTQETAEVLGARLAVATAADAFAGHDLVIEAVPEDLDLKLDALTRVEKVLGADAALAMGFVQKVVPAPGLDAAVNHWLALIGRATPKAVRNQKALMNRWERVSVDEGVYAGIDAISEAYTTGEPQAAIKAFFDAKKQKSGN